MEVVTWFELDNTSMVICIIVTVLLDHLGKIVKIRK